MARRRKPPAELTPYTPEQAATVAQYTRDWKNLDTASLKAAEEIAAAPDLLDPRRLVALLELITRQVAMPSEALVQHTAEEMRDERVGRIARARQAMAGAAERVELQPEEMEVSDVDVELARRHLLQGSIKMIERLNYEQREAIKIAQVDALFTLLLPMFPALGEVMANIITTHIPSNAQRELAMDDLKRGLIEWQHRARTSLDHRPG